MAPKDHLTNQDEKIAELIGISKGTKETLECVATMLEAHSSHLEAIGGHLRAHDEHLKAIGERLAALDGG